MGFKLRRLRRKRVFALGIHKVPKNTLSFEKVELRFTLWIHFTHLVRIEKCLKTGFSKEKNSRIFLYLGNVGAAAMRYELS